MIEGCQIQTVSGEYVWPLYPHMWTPRVEDVAHALSNLCRFTGHTRQFYSVAEHSVRVSDLLPAGLQLAGLLHDATEAYLGDFSSPLKHHPLLGEVYRFAERALEQRIGEVFNVDLDHSEVKRADLVLLATERRDLMPPGGAWKILEGIEPLAERIRPWPPRLARERFLDVYGRQDVWVAA